MFYHELSSGGYTYRREHGQQQSRPVLAPECYRQNTDGVPRLLSVALGHLLDLKTLISKLKISLNSKPAKMPEGKKKIPKPGPAKLSKNAGVDEWLKCAFNNQYLPESVMKKLCEICKEYLMEGRCSKLPGISIAWAMLIAARIKHTTSLNSRHRLWRPSRPVLRCPRIVPCRRRCSKRCTG